MTLKIRIFTRLFFRSSLQDLRIFPRTAYFFFQSASFIFFFFLRMTKIFGVERMRLFSLLLQEFCVFFFLHIAQQPQVLQVVGKLTLLSFKQNRYRYEKTFFKADVDNKWDPHVNKMATMSLFQIFEKEILQPFHKNRQVRRNY